MAGGGGAEWGGGEYQEFRLATRPPLASVDPAAAAGAHTGGVRTLTLPGGPGPAARPAGGGGGGAGAGGLWLQQGADAGGADPAHPQRVRREREEQTLLTPNG